jgi:hypothetical protein
MVQVFFGKFITDQLIKKFAAFMEPEGSLPCLQNPTIRTYPQPDQLHPNFLTLFL